jgi:Zn-dependent alcohol dehydrogenase
MSQEVRGVVARNRGAPVTLETIVIPDPGPGEVVVRIQACGVCHTDLHYREGGIDLYLQGRLPLDKSVSETIPLDQIEDAFTKLHTGEVLRSVVVL